MVFASSMLLFGFYALGFRGDTWQILITLLCRMNFVTTINDRFQ